MKTAIDPMQSTLATRCPHCGASSVMPAQAAGTTIPCNQCGRSFQAPLNQQVLDDLATEWITAGVEQIWGDREAALEATLRDEQRRIALQKEHREESEKIFNRIRPDIPGGRPTPSAATPANAPAVPAPKLTRALHGLHHSGWRLAS